MKKLLIVEDDRIMRQFYSILFQRNGFESFISDNGDAIIGYLNNEYVSLIILDINLNNTYLNGKQINGLMLLSAIKQIKRCDKIPIVLVTAHTLPLNNDTPGLSRSNEVWVTKPIANYSEFVNKINSLISN